MTRLEKIIKKGERIVVGLMSGTSVDSIDAVMIKIRGSGLTSTFQQIETISLPYPRGYKEFVLRNSLPESGTIDAISTLNILSAHLFADAVRSLAKKAGVPLSKIDLIGSHGQTIHHLPRKRKLFGKKISSTLQVGDPSTIAKLTGIITVGNFRTGDMALGGEGAPLIPFFDFFAFRSSKYNRAVLNIGGISNITLLNRNCDINDVLAFDTGPGNMVIDAMMKYYFNLQYDRNGTTAASGNILPMLLRHLMTHSYFKERPPKSTGREIFGEQFCADVLSFSRSAKKEDVVATLTEFTALSIFEQFNRFLRNRLHGNPLHELIISGGGSKNPMIVASLKKYFSPTTVLSSDERGYASRSKEALCFALLANETLCGNTTNVPSVTGAAQRTVLGTISI